MSISLATMGKFVGPVPITWDTLGGGGGGEVKYIDKKLPIVRVKKVNKKEENININISINKIKEE